MKKVGKIYKYLRIQGNRLNGTINVLSFKEVNSVNQEVLRKLIQSIRKR